MPEALVNGGTTHLKVINMTLTLNATLNAQPLMHVQYIREEINIIHIYIYPIYTRDAYNTNKKASRSLKSLVGVPVLKTICAPRISTSTRQFILAARMERLGLMVKIT
jgi:hypothetical protein